MNPEVKKKWLTALKSGEYEHKQGLLKDIVENKFCCLGVLCDIYIKETGKGEWKWGKFLLNNESSGTYLLGEVIEWAGLENMNPLANGYRLSEVNDKDTTKDFTEVIELIEKHL